MRISRTVHRVLAFAAGLVALLALFALTGCGQSNSVTVDLPSTTSTPSPVAFMDSKPADDGSTNVDAVVEETENERTAEQVVFNRPRINPAEPPPKRVRPRTRIRSGGVLDIVFDDLEFDLEADGDFEREMLTDEIEALDGKTVILRGFILDSSVFERTGIEKFVLVRDNQECCFGPTAKVFHNVWVELDKGKSTTFSFRPVEVKGKFSIRPWHHPADGKCYSVYHLQAESAK